jgi:hypothetical protein
MPTFRFAQTIAASLALAIASCAPQPSPVGGTEAEAIRASERARLAALVAGDAATAAAFHADEFQLVNPVGAVLSKAEYLGAVSSGQVDYIVWQPGEIAVRQEGRQAVIRYRSELQVTVGGRALPRTPHWHIDVYEKRDGRWQVIWSQATRVALPPP